MTPATPGGPRPSVSVVIPVYNGAQFIEAAIRSVARQTVPCRELIVVDDNSTDGTVALVGSLKNTVPFLDLITVGENSGPSYCRNLAVYRASGDFVAFLDADDRWDPEHIKTLLELHHAYPNASLYSTTGYSKHKQDGFLITRYDPDTAIVSLFRENFITQSACMVKRSSLLAVGGYQAGMRHSEDYDLWLRLCLTGATIVHSTAETCFRLVHEGQVSSAQAPMMVAAAWRVRRNIFEQMEASPAHAALLDQVQRLLSNLAVSSCRSALSSRDRDILMATIHAVEWTSIPRWHLVAWRLIGTIGWPFVKLAWAIKGQLPGAPKSSSAQISAFPDKAS